MIVFGVPENEPGASISFHGGVRSFVCPRIILRCCLCFMPVSINQEFQEHYASKYDQQEHLGRLPNKRIVHVPWSKFNGAAVGVDYSHVRSGRAPSDPSVVVFTIAQAQVNRPSSRRTQSSILSRRLRFSFQMKGIGSSASMRSTNAFQAHALLVIDQTNAGRT